MLNRLEYLLNLLKSSPEDAFVLFAVAKEYESAGDEAQALQFYLRLQSADPAYVGLYYHLGKLYERQNEPESAISTYQKGIEVCRQTGDRHAMSELQGALLNLQYE